MATKPRKATQPKDGAKEKYNPARLNIDETYIRDGDISRAKNGEMDAVNRELVARAVSCPEVRAARVIQAHEGENMDINACAMELRAQVSELNAGSMKRPEAMLISQAHTLDALFSDLAMRSRRNSTAGYLDAADRYMRLALRAQSQAVRTIEALSELKNPRPVAFVQQANIANGPQQINNGATPPAHGREITIEQTQLSEANNELLPDARASQAESRINPSLETVGEIHRAENGGG